MAEITNLAQHATRARDKLKGEYRKEREKEIEEADARFLQARGDMQKRIDEYPRMVPPDPLPVPSAAQDLEQKLMAMERHFNALKADSLVLSKLTPASRARCVWGSEFDHAACSRLSTVTVRRRK